MVYHNVETLVCSSVCVVKPNFSSSVESLLRNSTNSPCRDCLYWSKRFFVNFSSFHSSQAALTSQILYHSGALCMELLMGSFHSDACRTFPEMSVYFYHYYSLDFGKLCPKQLWLHRNIWHYWNLTIQISSCFISVLHWPPKELAVSCRPIECLHKSTLFPTGRSIYVLSPHGFVSKWPLRPRTLDLCTTRAQNLYMALKHTTNLRTVLTQTMINAVKEH